jgi:hypothetical protein
MLRKSAEFLKIVLAATLGSVIYGLIQDQITMRICLEYFTVGHPRIVESSDPTILALAWGVVATWWFGALLGLVLAGAARFGSSPSVRYRAILPGLLRVLTWTAAIASVSGLVGYLLVRAGIIWLTNSLAAAVPPEHHTAFLVDGAIHLGAYVTALVGGLRLSYLVFQSRKRASGSDGLEAR